MKADRISDLREALARDGTSSETHRQLADLVERNLSLQQQVESLRAGAADDGRMGSAVDAEVCNRPALDQYRSDHRHHSSDSLRLLTSQPSAEECAAFELAQQAYEAQITSLRAQLLAEQTERQQLESRYAKESQLMLSAWSELGNKVAKKQVGNAVAAAQVLAQRKRGERRPVPAGWLGRQRRWVEDGMFSR